MHCWDVYEQISFVNSARVEDWTTEWATTEFFEVSTKMADLIFLSVLYILTDALILSYVKMLSYAKDLIPDICGQHLNYSELHKIQISMHTIFLANANILW